jgi:hypothetical protein
VATSPDNTSIILKAQAQQRLLNECKNKLTPFFADYISLDYSKFAGKIEHYFMVFPGRQMFVCPGRRESI